MFKIIYLPTAEIVRHTKDYKFSKSARRFIQNHTFLYDYSDTVFVGPKSNFILRPQVPKHLLDVIEIL